MTTDNWTANGVGNWTTDADWSLGAPPTSGEDAFIGTGTGGIVGSSADVTVNSLGISSSYTLDINSGSVFSLTNGTGSQEVIGSIAILDTSSLQIQNNTFDNAGTVELESTGDATNITVLGTVSLTGGGSIELEPGVSGSQNALFGISASAKLFNVDNDISGTGVIENVLFTNEASGIIETNNSLGIGVMQIWGNAPFGGDFVNAGTVRADNGGTLQFGETPGSTSATFVNDGLIEALGANTKTLIYIAGNVTINQSSSGRILLAGSNTGYDFLVSNGIVGDATLTINGGLLDGAGVVGDRTALVLNIGAGTIVDADTPQILTLDTGSIPINNGGQIEAVGGVLYLDSPVDNNGNGTVSVGAGGALYLNTGASISGNVNFMGSKATLRLQDGTSQISGDIAGMAVSDNIDLRFQAFAAGDQMVWQQNGASGVLSLETSGGGVIDTLNLSGQYVSTDFVAGSDGQSGTLIGRADTDYFIASESATGDYYEGYVVDTQNQYTAGYGFTAGTTDQMGGHWTYYVTSVASTGVSASQNGYVYDTLYHDADLNTTFNPYYSIAGTNFLGTDADYVSTNGTYEEFGNETFVLPEVKTDQFIASESKTGDYYYGYVIDDQVKYTSGSGFTSGTADQFGGHWQYYVYSTATANVSPSENGYVFDTSYRDADLNTTFTPYYATSGTNFLGSDADYVSFNGSYEEFGNDKYVLPDTKVDYFIASESKSGDYYEGAVVDCYGAYSTGSGFTASTTDQQGGKWSYYVYSTAASTISSAYNGYVYDNLYYDADVSTSYMPYYSVSGTNFLGTDTDWIVQYGVYQEFGDKYYVVGGASGAGAPASNQSYMPYGAGQSSANIAASDSASAALFAPQLHPNQLGFTAAH